MPLKGPKVSRSSSSKRVYILLGALVLVSFAVGAGIAFVQAGKLPAPPRMIVEEPQQAAPSPQSQQADSQAQEAPPQKAQPQEAQPQEAQPQEPQPQEPQPQDSQDTPRQTQGAGTGGGEQPALAQPAIMDCVVVSKTSVRLHWDAIAGAEGYRVYATRGQGERKLVKTVEDPQATCILLKKLEYGSMYKFELTAYGAQAESAPAQRDFRLAVKLERKDGYDCYFDSEGDLVTDARGLVSKKGPFELRVNTKACVVTVFAKNKKGAFTVPVKTWLCSPSGKGKTASGEWDLKERFRWRTLFYNGYSQWGAVIHDDILFHTSPYTAPKSKKKLDVPEYNKLGTACSHGCVRMQCEAVKWIYDHCAFGTHVTIYKDKDPGPLGKPELETLPSWHTWDPTDPTCAKLCAKRGCHHEPTP